MKIKIFANHNNKVWVDLSNVDKVDVSTLDQITFYSGGNTSTFDYDNSENYNSAKAKITETIKNNSLDITII